MTPPSLSSVSRELPAQAAWMRELARGLVRDDATADDVAQDGAVAALRHGAAVRGELKPWLGRVVANLARRKHGEARLREHAEQRAARPELENGHAGLVERLDTQRALAEELRALDEPYRTTLLRRYFDGWSAARIARESGVPAATVRWRIQQGLARMRARLDRRHGGDRSTWRLALLPLAAPAPWTPLGKLASARPEVLFSGAVVMKAVHASLVAAVALAVGLGVWWRESSSREARVEPPIVAAQEPKDVSAPALDSPAEKEQRVVSAPAQAQPAAPVAVPAAQAPAQDGASLEARIVDASGRGIAGANVVELTLDGAPSARSDAAGLVRMELAFREPRRLGSLRVEAAGFATKFVGASLVAGETLRLGEIELSPGGAVEGRVQDSAGIALGDALVLVTAPDLWYADRAAAERCGPHDLRAPSSRSRADGTFRVEGVAAGGARAWAIVPGLRFGMSDALAVQAAETVSDVVLVVGALEADDEIAGTVLSPEGEPVADASLQINVEHNGSTNSFGDKSGRDGRFRFRVRAKAPHTIAAQDPRGRWQGARVEGIAPGAQDVRVVFGANKFVEVAVRGSGEPLQRFAAVTRSANGVWMIEGTGNLTNAEGRAKLRVPSEKFLVEVLAPGFAAERRGPFDPGAPPERLEFDLKPAVGISGLVTSAGAPRAGVKVTLWRCATKREAVDVHGYAALVHPTPEDTFETGDDGTFFLHVKEAGECVVRAEQAGFAPAELPPLSVQPDVAYSGLELALGPGGAIEGHVLVAPGRSPAGVVVAINRGDAQPRTVRSGEDGSFRFERVVPGRWHVARGKTEMFEGMSSAWAIGSSRAETKIPFNCDVHEGETATCDVDLRDDRPCTIEGSLKINGSPAAGWTIAIWPADKDSVDGPPPSTAVGADGSFAISLEDPGRIRLSLAPPSEVRVQGRIDVPFELVRGRNVWNEDVSVAHLEGRASVLPEEQWLYYVKDSGAPTCMLMLELDEHGAWSLPFVPAGRASFKILHAGPNGYEWTTVQECAPERGEKRTIALP